MKENAPKKIRFQTLRTLWLPLAIGVVTVAALAVVVGMVWKDYRTAMMDSPVSYTHLLFTCTVLGAQSSAISPFSSGGSLILGSCGNEEERSSLFNRLLFVATPISIGVAAIFNLIVSMVL